MEWYTGGVVNAIGLCRQNQSLFVVYVYDETPASAATDQEWETSQVTGLLSSRKCVALKLLKESLQCRQFSQLFPVFVYPSVFCIGSTGEVLVTMSGGQSAQQLVDKLTEGFAKLEAGLSVAPPQEGTPPPLTVTTPTSTADEPDSGQQPRLDEKVQRAKELVKQRRAEKEEKQLERGKSEEIQRREVGREITKVKEKHEERATQEWIQERRRQKEETKKAREEVKMKLDQDRRERESRAASQRERSVPSAIPTVMSSISASSGTCRIQLKLPGGGSTVVELERSARLAELRGRVAKEVGVAIENVTMTSMYPRQELRGELDDQTMSQLQLVPSAVLLVRVNKGFVSSLKSEGGGGVGGGVRGVVSYVFELLLWFITFIKNAIAGLFGGGVAHREDPSEDSQLPDVRRERLAALDGRGSTSGSGQEAGPRLRRFRQEDYQDDDDSDEDKKQTYNGNSTQQQ